MFNDQLLAGRRILVTGGGTGLGKSMASRFLQLGAEVQICGRRKSVCDETATELMDLHGGMLDIESEPRVGTTVTLTLPASRVTVPDAALVA